MDVEEKMEYYAELTDLVYEKYDLDHDEGLSAYEWHEFAKDIYDEEA